MVSVPAFLLRRLYVKESLKNNEDGFGFQLMNRLGSGYALKVHPLTVDGEEVATERSSFVLDGEATAFSEVSPSRTLTLAMNRSIDVRVTGIRLDDGPHKIGLGFDVPGLGTLVFDFTDTVAGD